MGRSSSRYSEIQEDDDDYNHNFSYNDAQKNTIDNYAADGFNNTSRITNASSTMHSPPRTTKGFDIERTTPGRTEEILPNGNKIIRYSNGTVKELEPNGYSVVRFTNGDTKVNDPTQGGKVIYYYAEAKTTHTTLGDGTEIYKFSNNQVETHYPNGSKEI